MANKKIDKRYLFIFAVIAIAIVLTVLAASLNKERDLNPVEKALKDMGTVVIKVVSMPFNFVHDKIDEMVEKNDPLVAIKENESLIILSYSAGNAGEALISAISRKFNVDANIVFGNVEIIANQAMGSLVVIISGELSDINQAVAYIRDAGVKVEVLKTC